ncbi:YoaK family protein [Streptomyces sp. NPDC051162]|uniref:YoaK family protein n=1 Tax=unclassified Streptomyces TaxID=2593676 RepID=UPI00341D4E58
MRRVLEGAADRLFPGGGNTHGTLPAALVLLTLVTGFVDAVSYLGLDHVFVANMTGNVVFLGFALAGARSLSAWASLLAFGAFMAGAWAVGRLGRAGRIAAGRRAGRHLRRGRTPVSSIAGQSLVPHTGQLFAAVTATHAALVTAALVVTLTAGHRTPSAKAALIALLACGMGMQNAVVRALGVPDLTTTVLTRTVTGLIADEPGPATVRRLVSLATMFVGALCGGALFLRAGAPHALAAAVVLLVVVTVTGARSRTPAG